MNFPGGMMFAPESLLDDQVKRRRGRRGGRNTLSFSLE
jgi:hypothetical protein